MLNQSLFNEICPCCGRKNITNEFSDIKEGICCTTEEEYRQIVEQVYL